MHHATLKSAVAKYWPLHKNGGTEQEVKLAIASDDKAFDEISVNEIYAAILAFKEDDGEGEKGKDGADGGNKGPESNNGTNSGKHIVVSAFRDINDFNKEWSVGTDVSHFDVDRLKKLTERNLVELQ